MGYWAKDHAYVHDDDDIRIMEAMNETQGQAFDRLNNPRPNLGFSEEEQREINRPYEKLVENKIKWYEGNRKYREYEAGKAAEREAQERQLEAYEAAKRRFDSLSPLKKLWFKLTNKNINHYNPGYFSTEELDSLYGGKSR